MEYEQTNNLFISKDYRKVLEFYEHFKDADQLIEWMRRRPVEQARISNSANVNLGVVAIVPTPDAFGKNATQIEKVLQGIPIVFSESKGDYWNYAYAANQAYAYALKQYRPKWVIVSNDDVQSLDNMQVLIKELDKYKDKAILHVQHNHQTMATIGKESVLKKILVHGRLIEDKRRALLRKFGVRYLPVAITRDNKIAYKAIGKPFRVTNDFFILNTAFFSDKIYDETFINEAEDVELSLRTRDNCVFIEKVKVQCGSGKSLGLGTDRLLRSVASLTYLQEKLSGISDIQKDMEYSYNIIKWK